MLRNCSTTCWRAAADRALKFLGIRMLVRASAPSGKSARDSLRIRLSKSTATTFGSTLSSSAAVSTRPPARIGGPLRDPDHITLPKSSK